MLNCFQNTTTFMAYMTAYDLEKSFSFNNTVEITGHIQVLSNSCINTMYLICAIYTKVWESERFQAQKMTFKVNQGNSY